MNETDSKPHDKSHSVIYSCYRRRRTTLIVCSTILVLIFLLLFRSSTPLNDNTPHMTHFKHHALFNDNKTAFVFGATDIYSTTELFKCTSAIESLVKIGGWGGDIYLLIDDTTCLDHKLMKSIPSNNIHIIPFNKDTDSSSSGGAQQTQHPHTASSSRRYLHGVPYNNNTSNTIIMHSNSSSTSSSRRKLFNSQPFERSMAIKTHILDYVKPNIETAIWYDCDVIFAIPGCVQKMVTTPVPITRQQAIAIPNRYHVGTFIVKQNQSNEALLQWREKILGRNGKSSMGETASFPDYMAFKELFGGHPPAVTPAAGGGSKPQLTNEKFLISPRVYHDVIVNPDIMNTTSSSSFAEQTDCVMHLTNGRCRHIPPTTLQSWFDEFHLDSLQGKKWCPSFIRRKFKTYGWKWPFCQTPSFFA